MDRYMVVANRTLGGQQLLDKVRECLAAGPCSFRVIVPVVTDDLEPSSHEDEIALARKRLRQELERLRAAGAEADGTYVEADPVDAALDAIGADPVDEIILCTLPQGISGSFVVVVGHD